MLEIRPANTLTVPSFASRTVNLDVDLGALAIRYVFSTTITDSDPGNGRLRLSATQQDAALTIRADTLDVNGADVSGLLDAFDDSTNATKGYVRIYAVGDPAKWLTFEATAVASPSGYRNITVSNVAASETSPFADGDTVLMSFQPNGDRGAVGPSASSPADRTDLAALDTTTNSTAYLREVGREGQFIWRTGDYSAEVTADPRQGIYVAPSSDATGASGAWVRVAEKLTFEMWGAVGNSDGTPGNGADDTAAIQAAFDYSASTGRWLDPLPKTYRATAAINLPKSVKMRGVPVEPVQFYDAATIQTRGKGTWFYGDHAGRVLDMTGPTGSGFTTSGTHLSGFGTIRNQPLPGAGAFSPANNDWDIYVENTDFVLEDVMLWNSTLGIRGTNLGTGRPTLRNIRGQPLSIGMDIDLCYDVCRVTDVHFWQFWSGNVNVLAHQMTNARGIRSGKNDNPFFLNIFVIFYAVGLELYSTAEGSTQKGKFVNVDLDRGTTGILVTGSSVNADFVGFSAQAEGATYGNGGGLTVTGNNNVLTLANADIREFGGNAVYVGGTGNHVQLDGKVFIVNWASGGGGFPGVEVSAANTVVISSRVIVGTTVHSGAPLFTNNGTLRHRLNYGRVSGTTDANGDLVVTHESRATPVWVSYTVQSGVLGATAQVQAVSATTFTIRFYNASGVPIASTAVQLSWETYLG